MVNLCLIFPIKMALPRHGRLERDNTSPQLAHFPVVHIMSEFLDKSKMRENLGSFGWKRGDT